MTTMCGGTGQVKIADEETQSLCNQVKPDCEQKSGKTYDTFEAHSYISQVVAGTNFFVKVHVGNDDHVHLRIYRKWDGAVELHSYQDNKAKDDEIVYFE